MDNNKALVYIIGIVCGMFASVFIVSKVSDSKVTREREKTIQEKENTIQYRLAWRMDSVRVTQNKYTWKSDSINNVGNPCENENR